MNPATQELSPQERSDLARAVDEMFARIKADEMRQLDAVSSIIRIIGPSIAEAMEKKS